MWRSPRRDITLRLKRTIPLAAVAVALLALPALAQENDPEPIPSAASAAW